MLTGLIWAVAGSVQRVILRPDQMFLKSSNHGDEPMKQNTYEQVVRVGTLARALKLTIERVQEPGADDLAEYATAECLIEKIIGNLAKIAEETEQM
jgi:hypothetical protein